MVSEDAVKDDIKSASMGFVNEVPQVGECAEMRVYGEVIVGEVSGGLEFFAAFGFGAVKYGGEPDGVGAYG